MKILLLQPKLTRIDTAPLPPLGLCYIQSCLDKACYTDSKIIDIFESYNDIEKIIKDYKPDIVGISCFTTYRGSSFKLAKLVKEVNPKIKVVLGGPHATFMWEQIMKNFPFVDFIVMSEGEITTVELVKTLDKGLPLKNVKGIVFRDNGEIIKNEPRPFIENLDELPFPSYRDIDFKKYIMLVPPIVTSKEVKANIISSRGCYGKCTFCSTKVFWGNWRARSPKNVVDEIEWLYNDYGIKLFEFLDDIFTTNQKRVTEICKEIIKRNLKIKWNCETRVNNVSLELFQWMKRAGCCWIEFGVESGSEKILKNINKMITRDQIIRAFKLAKEAGIKRGIFLMVGNPEDSWETIKETEDLITEIKPDNVAVSVATIYPATQLYELAKEKGLINDDYWLTDKLEPRYTIDINLKELTKMTLHIYKHFLYKNKGFAFIKFALYKIKYRPKILLDYLKYLIDVQ